MTENRILDHLKEIKRNLFEGKYTQDEKEHIEETLEALLHPNSLRDTNEAKRYLELIPVNLIGDIISNQEPLIAKHHISLINKKLAKPQKRVIGSIGSRVISF